MPVVLSLLRSPLLVPRRFGGHGHVMTVTPSRFMWDKFKDMLHFYTMLGLIPTVCLATYVNLTVGPAELTETPDGYEPSHWEYERHPMTRLLARLFEHPAIDYERKLHVLNREMERMMLKRIEFQVRNIMAVRNDYEAWYYEPAPAKHVRVNRDVYYRHGEAVGVNTTVGLDSELADMDKPC